MNQTHIVCLRFSSLGDVLLQSSFFSMLKKEYGSNVKVTLMTADEFAPLFVNHPHVDNILGFSRKNSLSRIFKIFKKFHGDNQVDFIFDLHNTTRANLLKLRFFSIPKIAVDKRKIERKLLVSPLKLKLLSLQSIMDRVLGDFNFLWGSNYSRKTLSQFIFKGESSHNGISSLAAGFNNEIREKTKEAFQLKDMSFIAIIPSASHLTKRWPLENFIELTRKLLQTHSVVILAGPDDDFCDAFNEITTEKNSEHKLYNLQGKTSFQESSDLVGGAQLCIGNDTGLIHMAEAQAVSCIMIMGPTSEAFGFAPHLNNSYTFSHELSCRPCSSNGSKDCTQQEKYCLTNTQSNDVFDKALEILKC